MLSVYTRLPSPWHSAVGAINCHVIENSLSLSQRGRRRTRTRRIGGGGGAARRREEEEHFQPGSLLAAQDFLPCVTVSVIAMSHFKDFTRVDGWSTTRERTIVKIPINGGQRNMTPPEPLQVRT